jgi:hypothetical protein
MVFVVVGEEHDQLVGFMEQYFFKKAIERRWTISQLYFLCVRYFYLS